MNSVTPHTEGKLHEILNFATKSVWNRKKEILIFNSGVRRLHGTENMCGRMWKDSACVEWALREALSGKSSLAEIRRR
jgi:hypothetical protein